MHDPVLADHVKCNDCGRESYVLREDEHCPHCGVIGCLEDIHQDIHVQRDQLGPIK